jgi:hypothetical protein
MLILAMGYQGLGIGCRVLGVGYWVLSGIGYRILNIGYLVLGTGVSGVGYLVDDLRNRVSEIGGGDSSRGSK